MRTANDIIQVLTGTEFNEMNRHGGKDVDDHSRVVLARIMAQDADLPPHEQEKLMRWAEDLMSQPSVNVTLTERERARLWERLQETFKGDRGAVLGFIAARRRRRVLSTRWPRGRGCCFVLWYASTSQNPQNVAAHEIRPSFFYATDRC